MDYEIVNTVIEKYYDIYVKGYTVDKEFYCEMRELKFKGLKL